MLAIIQYALNSMLCLMDNHKFINWLIQETTLELPEQCHFGFQMVQSQTKKKIYNEILGSLNFYLIPSNNVAEVHFFSSNTSILWQNYNLVIAYKDGSLL